MTSKLWFLLWVLMISMPFVWHSSLYFPIWAATQVFLFICLLASMMKDAKKGRENFAPTLHAQVRSAIEPLGVAEFAIILEDAGQRRITAGKCLRQLYDLGLRDAVLIVKHTPSVIKPAASKEEADFVAARLAACGATVKIVAKPE